MPLHPQVVALVAAMDRPDRPKIQELPIEAARKIYGAMPDFMGDLGFSVPTENRSIPGPAGDIGIRIYTPDGDGSRPITVFYHGGGFCIGDLDTHDRECQAISQQSGSVVVAVDYRMGPEHAYTAAADQPPWVTDGWAALQWVRNHVAELGGSPERLAVCGDSAGANISAVMAQMSRDAGLDLALQVLVYPATDLRDEAYDLYPSYAEHAEAPILERPVLDYFRDQSRPDGDPTAPSMSPALHDDLSGLAPAFIITAEYDPLRDDGEAYAAKLGQAGVEVTLKRYEGMPHGFFNLGPHVDAAADAVGRVADAIAKI